MLGVLAAKTDGPSRHKGRIFIPYITNVTTVALYSHYDLSLTGTPFRAKSSFPFPFPFGPVPVPGRDPAGIGRTRVRISGNAFRGMATKFWILGSGTNRAE